MKKIIIAAILLMYISVSLYAQEPKKSPPEVKNYGPYTVTIDNGKVSVKKNPNFDTTKMIRRDTTTSPIPLGILEIYYPGNNTPVVKKYLIHDLNSIISERMMPREERMSKYHSRAGVTAVYLKPGVITLNAAELLNKFKVSKRDANLPLYEDYKPIDNPNNLLAVPDVISKITVIKDGDGFRFLNITTKRWEEDRRKYKDGFVINLK